LVLGSNRRTILALAKKQVGSPCRRLYQRLNERPKTFVAVRNTRPLVDNSVYCNHPLRLEGVSNIPTLSLEGDSIIPTLSLEGVSIIPTLSLEGVSNIPTLRKHLTAVTGDAPKFVAEWLTIQLRIREVLCSNLITETGYPDWTFS
jgi:hypothetical protein